MATDQYPIHSSKPLQSIWKMVYSRLYSFFQYVFHTNRSRELVIAAIYDL